MKYLCVLCVILGLALCILKNMYDDLKNENTTLQIQKNALYGELKRRNDNAVAVSCAKADTKKAVAEDKSGFDWHFDYSSSSPIMQLRKSCRSCANSADQLHK